MNAGWPAGSRKTRHLSGVGWMSVFTAPSSMIAASPASRSSTSMSRWACCGRSPSGQVGGRYRSMCWKAMMPPLVCSSIQSAENDFSSPPTIER